MDRRRNRFPSISGASRCSTRDRSRKSTCWARATSSPKPSWEAKRSQNDANLIVPLLVVAGLGVGIVVGRWWALAAPAAFAVYVAVESDVDVVPPLFLGVFYGLVGAAAVGAGVLIRRFATRPR